MRTTAGSLAFGEKMLTSPPHASHVLSMPLRGPLELMIQNKRMPTRTHSLWRNCAKPVL